MRILLASANAPLQVLIKRALHRFQYEWDHAGDGFEAFQKALSRKYDLLLLDFDLPRMKAYEVLTRFRSLEGFVPPPALVLTLSEEERLLIENGRFPRTEVMARPMVVRRFVETVQTILGQEIRIACIGGGTGLFTLLMGLKTLTGVRLSSIVTMSDDGGSTGRLRDMFGILPPGDVRRSLIALSTAPDLLNELMQYRFARGAGLEGHNLGNLLLTALSEMRGSMTRAVHSLGEILNVQGTVIPVTETSNSLKAELENGSVIHGESRIGIFEGHDPKLRIRRLWLEPDSEANPAAVEAIQQARYIVIGPGDLYTSIIANLAVKGIPEALQASTARKIYICNVMTKPGETTDFQVSDHVREIVRYLGKDVLDDVICSSTQYPYGVLQNYAAKGQIPVLELSNERLEKSTRAAIRWADIVSKSELVRHDSLKLAAEIKKIIDETRGI